MAFPYEEFDLSDVRTYPLASRPSKVRVGDFTSVEAAERLRERLVARGVEGAWTVRTSVRASP